MRIGRFEVASHNLNFNLLPRFSIFEDIGFDDTLCADEACLYWLWFRMSVYHNLMSYQEKVAKRLAS